MEQIAEYKTNILIVDSMNMAYKMVFKMPYLSASDGTASFTIYGFMLQLQNIYNKLQPDNVILTWDSPNNKRKKILKTYKNRIKTSVPYFKEFLEQIIVLKQVLPKIGITSIEIDGLESDDIIALVLHKIRTNPHLFTYFKPKPCYSDATKPHKGFGDLSKGIKTIIFSSDNDLYQLLDKNTCIFNGKQTITENNFIEKYSFQPRLFAIYKAIAGCSSDTVKGLDGMGEKRTIEFIKNCECNIDTIYNKIDKMGKTKEFNESLRLVTLPLDMEYNYKFNIKPLKIDIGLLSEFLLKYDIHSILPSKFLNRHALEL